MPVPAPATEAILHGVPTTRGGVGHEATTPTGAAILAGLTDRFIANPALTALGTGHGIGHREADLPNVLRVHLAEADAAHATGRRTRARLLACNIDDMTAEALGDAMDLLMEQGAMDVHFTPIVMKKNRPATSLSLLCDEADAGRFQDLLFRHTTTLGVKSIPVDKTELERRSERPDTPLAPVTLKCAILNGEQLRAKPEFDDCRALARKHGIPLAEVYAQVARCLP
ncbi:nickel pincer cofactor biosynthesis protein LarC2 [Desulfocurvus sp. DL9XJH121]